MNNISYKMLKHIATNDSLNELLIKFSTDANRHERILMLYNDEYIDFSEYAHLIDYSLTVSGFPDPETSKVKLTLKGETYLDERKYQYRKDWIPIAISIAALIKSFSPELLLLLEQVSKLIKP